MKVAFIRAEDCVGCARCVPACPVDAIIGAPKFLHDVLLDACIGCELCVAPCPTQCIEIHPVLVDENKELRKIRALKAKDRYLAHQQRKIRQTARPLNYQTNTPEFKALAKKELQAAFLRVQQKRQTSTLEMK